jgi:hypothetical protein
MAFFDGLVVSDIPLLRDFIDRTKLLIAPHRAKTSFSDICGKISLFRRKGEVDFKVLRLETYSSDLRSRSQLALLTEACSSLLPPLPSLEYLDIFEHGSALLRPPRGHVGTIIQWTELLRPFITVKYLVLGKTLIWSVASTLQELVGEQGTEILPALQIISLVGLQSSDPVPEGIMKFIVARGRSGRPVFVHH